MAKRSSLPTAEIAYHTMADDPDGEAGSFTLAVKNKVYFVVAKGQKGDDEGGEASGSDLTQLSVASCIPQAVWDSSSIVKVIWAVKWGIQGLTPIRPVVCMLGDVIIGAGRAIK
eukprot:5931925-Pyramimonas_sp.AAC.1